MNSKNLLFLAIGLIAFSIISAKSAYACDGDCGKNPTSTCQCQGAGCSTSTCPKPPKMDKNSTSTPRGCDCAGQEDCKCEKNKECKCENCKPGDKNCKCENCKQNGTTTATTTKEKVFKNNASQTGAMARIKGWLKGFAFWKRK